MNVQNFILCTAFLAFISHDALASDVQVVLKSSSETTRRSIYTINSGDIDGQATITAVDSATTAQSMVNAEIVGVKSTFNNSNAPYGGHITSTIKCHTHKYIKEKSLNFSGEKTQVILAVASSRRIFGICAADEISFASGTWAGYDKTKSRVLAVKLFKPISNPVQIDKSQQAILEIFNKVITHL